MKMKHLYFVLYIGLISCGEDKPAVETEKTEPNEQLSMEELIDRKVKAELSIPGTVNYTMSIHKAQLNDDEFEDAIIVVNRKEHTLQSAIDKNNVAYQEEVGYFGNYNFLFYYDGMTHTVTRKIAVPSNGLIPLKVEFANILTEGYKDFTLDVRIREARYRNFYTVRKGAPALIFQCEIHNVDDVNNFNVNHVKYDVGSHSLSKDIVIYNAKVKFTIPKDLSSDFEIETEPKGEEKFRFFYYPAQQKYFIKKDQIQ